MKTRLMAGAAAMVLSAAALAQTAPSPGTAPTNAAGDAARTKAPGAAQATGVEDIIVTAAKRSERLNQVAGAVTALGGQKLDAIGARNLADFAALVPGLNFQSGGPGASTLTVRGINTGVQASPLVGVVLDGVPYGSSSSFAFAGLIALDSALWDTDRVEVLRGPQGTLYGASTMGGLINYIYKEPNPSQYSGNLEAEVAGTEHGGVSHIERATVNLPLVQDQMALRLSGSWQDNAGFIDNVQLHRDGINDSQIGFLHGSLLWQPNSKLTIEANGLYQKLSRDSGDDIYINRQTEQPLTGDLEQRTSRLEPTTLEYAQGALRIAYDVGPFTITSITGYQRDRLFSDPDFSFSGTGELFAGLLHATSTDILTNAVTDKVTEEFRLASPDNQRLRWLAGMFYTSETSTNSQDIGFDLPGFLRLPRQQALLLELPSTYEEIAGFGQLTYAITEKFDLTGGVRYSSNNQDFAQTNGGLLRGLVGLPASLATQHSSDDQATFLVTARYLFDPENTAYVRIASGYRPGGPNAAVAGLPRTFQSDTLTNYEIGYKTRFWNDRASVQLAAFYIDWKDIQVTVASGGLSGFANGGAATSRGIEAEGQVRPIPGLALGVAAAITDAYLDDPITAFGARAGERLPNTPRWTVSGTGDYEAPISDRWKGFLGTTVRAVGARTASFDADAGAPQYRLPFYVLLDLRAGVRYENWRLTAFLRNATNERAQLSANTSYTTGIDAAGVTLARPRTVGLTLSTSF